MIKTIVFLSILVLFITGCRNRPVNEDRVDSDLPEIETIEEFTEVYYRFPAPDEMLNFINREELQFTDEFLHPVNKSTSYLDSRAQALNLGVYTADMAYITLFERQKEALNYLRVIYRMSDQLRISAAFDSELLMRIEKNMKYPDSIKVIADEAFTDIIDYLVRNDKEKVFAIISIGGFIEGLYIAYNLAGEYSEDNPIIQRISDQKLVLKNLLGYCQAFADDENVIAAMHLLDSVRNVYDQLVVKEEATTISETDDGSFIIDGGNKITITEKQFNELHMSIVSARSTITDNLVN